MVRWVIGCVFVAATGWATPLAAAADDPIELERVWQHTLVVFPQNPADVTTRGRNLERALGRYKITRKLPAVIFAHGCTGLSLGSKQTTHLIPELAKAGFVVFAPDGLERPREPYCYYRGDGSLIANSDTQSIPNRIAEVRSTLERIRRFEWIDTENVFLAGHSHGGNTVVRYPYRDFRAMVAFGWNCPRLTVNWFLNGFDVPHGIPLLTIFGGSDEILAVHNPGVHCGQVSAMRSDPDRVSVVLEGRPHDVHADPEAMPMAIAFLRRYATRRIDPVAPVIAQPSSLYDGTWSGRLECPAFRTSREIRLDVKLNVRDGRFSWRVTVPAGVRGFDGLVDRNGLFSARAYIGRNSSLTAEEGAASWKIAFEGLAAGTLISADGVWADQPCSLVVRRP